MTSRNPKSVSQSLAPAKYAACVLSDLVLRTRGDEKATIHALAHHRHAPAHRRRRACVRASCGTGTCDGCSRTCFAGGQGSVGRGELRANVGSRDAYDQATMVADVQARAESPPAADKLVRPWCGPGDRLVSSLGRNTCIPYHSQPAWQVPGNQLGQLVG